MSRSGEMADTPALGAGERKLMEVQVLSPAPVVTCSELRKPARRRSLRSRTPQKNTLCSFHFARAGFFLLLMKRVFFCGALPSKYSGRWRDWPHFDLAREKRNSPQTPLPLFSCSNGTGKEAGGQKFLPPNPLPFCPPAWASPPKLSDGQK